jgi:gliding motility-associated lipoprotein GldH
MISLKNSLIIIIAGLYFASCGKIDLYEKNVEIPSQQWFYNYQPSFTFNITDTTAAYSVYIVIRHTDLYTNNNIWLNLGSRAPGDTIRYQNLNLQLASDAGGWEGRGMDDIWEVRKNITPGPIPFKKPGNYTFTIGQIMRQNPLKHVLNVGIRVEKVEL